MLKQAITLTTVAIGGVTQIENQDIQSDLVEGSILYADAATTKKDDQKISNQAVTIDLAKTTAIENTVSAGSIDLIADSGLTTDEIKNAMIEEVSQNIPSDQLIATDTNSKPIDFQISVNDNQIEEYQPSIEAIYETQQSSITTIAGIMIRSDNDDQLIGRRQYRIS